MLSHVQRDVVKLEEQLVELFHEKIPRLQFFRSTASFRFLVSIYLVWGLNGSVDDDQINHFLKAFFWLLNKNSGLSKTLKVVTVLGFKPALQFSFLILPDNIS